MSERVDNVAEPLLWNLNRLIDEYGWLGVKRVLERMRPEEPAPMPEEPPESCMCGVRFSGTCCMDPNQ